MFRKISCDLGILWKMFKVLIFSKKSQTNKNFVEFEFTIFELYKQFWMMRNFANHNCKLLKILYFFSWIFGENIKSAWLSLNENWLKVCSIKYFSVTRCLIFRKTRKFFSFLREKFFIIKDQFTSCPVYCKIGRIVDLCFLK